MKFGGAAVATPDCFHKIAKRVAARHAQGVRTVVVLSAMGDSTDALIALARQVHPQPPRREYDMLVSVGERVSCALLAMALDLCGVEAMSVTGSQAGIITSTEHQDAHIVAVRPIRVQRYLDEGTVVIVAGFQGVSELCEITTLGRGGSDTTAVALAVALSAECVEFYKDVDGIYSADPKTDPGARRLPKLDYAEAIEVASRGHSVLAPRCLSLAERNQLPLFVHSFHGPIDGPPGSSIVGSLDPNYHHNSMQRFLTGARYECSAENEGASSSGVS
jgi:aspartate kinase